MSTAYNVACQVIAAWAIGWWLGGLDLRARYRRRRERWFISGRWFGHGRLVIWGARRGDTTVGDPHDRFMEALRNASRFRGSWHTNHVHISTMRDPEVWPSSPMTSLDLKRAVDLSMKIDRLEP